MPGRGRPSGYAFSQDTKLILSPTSNYRRSIAKLSRPSMALVVGVLVLLSAIGCGPATPVSSSSATIRRWDGGQLRGHRRPMSLGRRLLDNR